LDRHGGCKTGSADGHGIVQAQTVRQRNDPVTVNFNKLGKASVILLAQSASDHKHRIPWIETGIFGRVNGSGCVDPGHQWKFFHNPPGTGGGQCIFVIDT